MSNLKEEVIKEIKKIYDPEIPVNIYDLGLIYDISVKDKHVDIKMTLTSPNCPVADLATKRCERKYRENQRCFVSRSKTHLESTLE